MTYNLKVVFLGFATLLASSSVMPSAKADEWNKKTVVTFSAPVEVPGKVLPEGTYVFKLADSQSNRGWEVRIPGTPDSRPRPRRYWHQVVSLFTPFAANQRDRRIQFQLFGRLDERRNLRSQR